MMIRTKGKFRDTEREKILEEVKLGDENKA